MSAESRSSAPPVRSPSLDAIAFDVALLAFLVLLPLALPEGAARLVPLIVVVPTILGVGYQLYVDLVPSRHPEAAAPDAPPPDVRRRELIFVGWLLAFFVLAWLTSFLVVLPLALVAIFRFVNGATWTLSLALSGGMWAFIYLMFSVGLGVRF